MKRSIQRNPFERAVHFSQDELTYIRHVAEERQAMKEDPKCNAKDNRIVKRPNVELHYVGLVGECAVARLVGGYPDLRAYIGGSGADLMIYGVSIEIKCLKGYLAFKSLDHFTTDVAALVIHDPSDLSCVWVEGWITRSMFIENHFIDDFGYGMRPCIQPSDLLPIGTLGTFCLMWKMFGQITQDKSALAASLG